jgi:hypothetical protein
MPQRRGDRFETARRLGHVPIVENELVQEELENFHTKEADPDDAPIEENSVDVADLPGNGINPNYMFSIDGSLQEIPTNEDYPSNRIGFIQLAAVLTKLDILEEQQQERFVDPSRVDDLEESVSQPIILPSSNYTMGDATTTRESWRQHLYNTFTTREIEDRTYLDIFLDVIKSDPRHVNKRTVNVYRCPNPDCPTDGTEAQIHTDIHDFGNCDECGIEVYPTDSLRTHERVSETQPNGTALSAVMQVLEHLTLCAYLRYLSERNPERLSRVGFVLDGPLAIYDTPAWLHEPVFETIETIFNRQRELDYEPPIVVGVEKGGQFNDHALNVKEAMERGSVLAMDNEYIYEYVKSGSTDLEYGERTHYGWPFIYKSQSERIFVLDVPQVYRGSDKYDPASYPLIRKTLETITSVETALYDDATIPITLAHQSASIPLKTGTRVLELFSREFSDDS